MISSLCLQTHIHNKNIIPIEVLPENFFCSETGSLSLWERLGHLLESLNFIKMNTCRNELCDTCSAIGHWRVSMMAQDQWNPDSLSKSDLNQQGNRIPRDKQHRSCSPDGPSFFSISSKNF